MERERSDIVGKVKRSLKGNQKIRVLTIAIEDGNKTAHLSLSGEELDSKYLDNIIETRLKNWVIPSFA